MDEFPFESPTERSSRCELNLYGVKRGFGITEKAKPPLAAKFRCSATAGSRDFSTAPPPLSTA